MFKIILLFVLIISCGSMGLIKSQEYAGRVKYLEQLVSTLNFIDTEISYKKETLPQIFQHIASYSDDYISQMLIECCKYMKQNMDIEICWRNAVDKIYSDSCLTGKDLYILRDLGKGLGKSDIKGQHNIFRLTSERLQQQIKDAVREKNTKGKMYSGMGFSVGIVAAVLLI